MKFRYYSFKLSGIMILVFLVQFFIPSFEELFILNQSSFIQAWRFFTAIFLHASLAHLILNLFALILFGSILESLIGGRRFLFTFFATGLLANLVAINFYQSSLGASGAIFGVIGALIIVRPMLPVWAFGLPMPIFVAGIIWIGADLLGTAGFLMGNPIDNTGNIAHLSGVFFGFLLGAWYRRNMPRRIRKRNLVIPEDIARRWEDAYVK